MKIKKNRTKKGTLRKEKLCKECNTGFLSNRNTAKYCSDTCKDKSYRNRLKRAIMEQIKESYGL